MKFYELEAIFNYFGEQSTSVNLSTFGNKLSIRDLKIAALTMPCINRDWFTPYDIDEIDIKKVILNTEFLYLSLHIFDENKCEIENKVFIDKV